jgi:8-oxo-dGTP diphosphatase
MTPARAIKILDMKSIVYHIVANILPVDNLEREHIQDTLTWIQSGEPIFRVQKPDVPPKHLVSYFVLFDENAKKVLLVDHKKAKLWLPSGGHVEVGEHPRDAAVRECLEELEIEAEFWKNDPIFLTSTKTVGLTAGHTDVSLWYVLSADHQMNYQFDAEEFTAIEWFSLDKIPYERSDPHMERFINKLKGCL